MNDADLKKLFKSMNHGEPTELEVARWKKIVRREILDRTPSEWLRLAVACLIGFTIGAVAFKGPSEEKQKIVGASATIERVYVNME